MAEAAEFLSRHCAGRKWRMSAIGRRDRTIFLEICMLLVAATWLTASLHVMPLGFSSRLQSSNSNGGPSFSMGRARTQPHDGMRLDSAYSVSSAFIHFPDIALNARKMKSLNSKACLIFITQEHIDHNASFGLF